MKRTRQQETVVYVQRNRAAKIVRQIYLRGDIPCHIASCDTQRSLLAHATSAAGQQLSEAPAEIRPYGMRYLLPDTNVFYHAIDVMEQSNCFRDVIVLQTVLDELRNKNMGLYERLRRLVQDNDKRFVVFYNEICAETHVHREANETINDRNDRSIVKSADWYNKLLLRSGGKQRSVLLLSDDAGVRSRCEHSDVDVQSAENFLRHFELGDRYLDMLSSSTNEGIGLSRANSEQSPRRIYPKHLGLSAVLNGVRSGLLYRAVISIDQRNNQQGTMAVKGFEQPVQVVGYQDLNRATDGDTVAIQMLPEADWRGAGDRLIIEDDEPSNAEDELRANDRSPLASQAKKVPTARVVGILRRNWRPFVCTVDTRSVSSDYRNRGLQPVYVRPLDRRIPRIRIRTRQLASLLDQKLVVSVDRWSETTRFPEGHLISVLGSLESIEAETSALLLEHGVSARPFPKVVLDCLPSEGSTWTVKEDMQRHPGQNGKRADLRHLHICSIDPPGCQDIDDALHARMLPNGNIEAGVHIADVSNFVSPLTAMDDEAMVRGTTVYMVDKRIDMLPALLGTNLCSLMPYVERYAFTVTWEFDNELNVVKSTFTKSIIQSKEAFTYEAAQSRIDDESQKDELSNSMRLLLRIARVLKARRVAAGALNLASPEIKIQMGNETSEPVDVLTKEAHETNSLVEEFMLLANISVARRIYEAFPESAILRRHGAPPSSSFDTLRQALRERRGIDLRVDSSRAVADSLDACIDPNDPTFNTLVRIMATRCMLSAEYFYAGQYSRDEFRHYGLATDIYTHFTSPIRRYADIIAHRQLAAAIGWEDAHASLINEEVLELTCKNINYRHRMGQLAGRASVEFFVGQALKNKETLEQASVLQVFSNGFVVFVPSLGIEGTIHLADVEGLNATHTEFIPDKFLLRFSRAMREGTGSEAYTSITMGTVGRRGELDLGIFDKIQVKVSTTYKEATGRRLLNLQWIL
ncbi:exosome catalytic subunit dis3 [Savitreella phatthalungensis]